MRIVPYLFMSFLVCLLRQLLLPELEHAIEEMTTCVSPVNRMVPICIDLHVKLFVGLHKGFAVFGCVAEMDVVVSHAVNEQQASFELGRTQKSR